MKIWVMINKAYSGNYENTRFLEEAKNEGIDFQFVQSSEFDILVSAQGEQCILHNGQLVELPHCFIPRRGASTTYFDLAVIRQLERTGSLVLNNSSAIEISKDKLHTLQILAENKIPILKTMLLKLPFDVELIEQHFTYPVIVKTISGSEGKGVFLCEDRNKFEDFLGFIESTMSREVNIIVQEFAHSSAGKDIRVLVVGGRALGAMLRIAKMGKIKANVSAGGAVDRFPLNPEIEWLAVESARILGLDIAGVDVFFYNESYVVNEVNSSPGFKGFEQATGVNVPKEIFQFIKVRLGIS